MKKTRLFKSYISLRSVWNVCVLLLKSNYGAYIGEGPQVKAFEQEFSEKFGLKNVAALNSGTSALELAYELAGVGVGDEVITPVLTAPATNLPLLHRGATIVFADVEKDLNISIADVKRKITPKTKAIVFVHFAGNNRGLEELLEIAKDRNLPLIEDAAQAVGTDFWGKGDFVCVSLQAIKVLTSGDGGFLVTKDATLHEKGKRLRWFGYDRALQQKVGDTDIVEAGYKYHMSDITAAIGRGNLRSLDALIAHRKKLVEEYQKHGVQASLWFATTFSPAREALQKFLQKHGVASGTHHFRNDKYSVFGGRRTLPVMDALESQYLLLPLHHGVSVKDVGYICTLIHTFNEIPKS